MTEQKISHIAALQGDTTEAVGFTFDCTGNHYGYWYDIGNWIKQLRQDIYLVIKLFGVHVNNYYFGYVINPWNFLGTS